MKRMISIMLAVLLTFSCAACSGTADSSIKKPAEVTTDAPREPDRSTEKEDKEVSAAKPSDEPEEEDAQEPAAAPANLPASIDEVVLVDEAGIKITAKSLDNDALFGPELKLLIENDSGNDLTVQCRNASVNGYMADTMMSVDVANGKKANDSLTFMRSSLEDCGIETIADMEFSFHCFLSDDWSTYLDTAQICLRTSAADTYEYSYDDSGSTAYDANGIKIVVKGLSEGSSFLGPGIVVYIENNSDHGITVQTRNVSINGFMIDAIFSSDTAIGKRCIDTITFMSSDLEENDITAIESVELSFHIFDSDSWNTIVDTEQITISF